MGSCSGDRHCTRRHRWPTCARLGRRRRRCGHTRGTDSSTWRVHHGHRGLHHAGAAGEPVLDELTVKHRELMEPVRAHIKLMQGDIVQHLTELLAHSHVFLLDARFSPSLWRLLAYRLSYLSGVTHQAVVSCQELNKCNSDLLRADALSLSISGGQQFTVRVFHVDPRMSTCGGSVCKRVYGLGVRAARALRSGQTIVLAEGETLHVGAFAAYSDVEKQGTHPYLARGRAGQCDRWRGLRARAQCRPVHQQHSQHSASTHCQAQS